MKERKPKLHVDHLEVDAAGQVFHIPREGLAVVTAACLSALDARARARVLAPYKEPEFESIRRLRSRRDALELRVAELEARRR